MLVEWFVAKDADSSQLTSQLLLATPEGEVARNTLFRGCIVFLVCRILKGIAAILTARALWVEQKFLSHLLLLFAANFVYEAIVIPSLMPRNFWGARVLVQIPLPLSGILFPLLVWYMLGRTRQQVLRLVQKDVASWNAAYSELLGREVCMSFSKIVCWEKPCEERGLLTDVGISQGTPEQIQQLACLERSWVASVQGGGAGGGGGGERGYVVCQQRYLTNWQLRNCKIRSAGDFLRVRAQIPESANQKSSASPSTLAAAAYDHDDDDMRSSTMTEPIRSIDQIYTQVALFLLFLATLNCPSAHFPPSFLFSAFPPSCPDPSSSSTHSISRGGSGVCIQVCMCVLFADILANIHHLVSALVLSSKQFRVTRTQY